MSTLKNSPINVDDDNWYYEEKKGICVVHRARDEQGNHLQTDQFYIPWKRILESVKRKYPTISKP